MASGYTCDIENGKIKTGKDFLERCIHAFGVAVDYKDEPLDKRIPDKLVISPHYEKEVKDAMNALSNIESMSDEELASKKDAETNEMVKKCNEEESSKQAALEAYRKVRSEVEMWTPPTSEHEGIKSFALDQIDQSVEWLGPEHSSYYKRRSEELINQSLEDYKANLLAKAQEHLEYSLKFKREEEERISKKNKFLKEFRESLKNI